MTCLRKQQANPPLDSTQTPPSKKAPQKINLRNLTWKQLRSFAATIQYRSVSGAAEHLNVTPPAVSLQLRALQDSIGAPLFTRSAGSMFTPTVIGLELHDLAVKIENLTSRTADRIAALKYGVSETFILGASYGAKYLAPTIVADFKRDHPNIEITLVIRDRKNLLRALQGHEIDLAMTSHPPKLSGITSTAIGDHPYVLIASPDHCLVGKPEISIEDLLDERILIREQGSHTRILTDRFFDQIGRSFNMIETGATETIKQAVMAGLGIAIISAHTCKNEITCGRLVTLPVPQLPLKKQWLLLTNNEHAQNPITETFKTYMMHSLST